MNIEQQVTCLELSKQLKAAGYPQKESRYYWGTAPNSEPILLEHIPNPQYPNEEYVNVNDLGEIFPNLELMQDDVWDFYAAPSTAELGEKLPRELSQFLLLEFHKGRGEWGVAYRQITENPAKNYWKYEIWEKTEADARAKMWLYLKEKGLLDDTKR